MASAAGRRSAVLFLFVTVALDTMAIGLTIPVLPKLIGQIGGTGAARTAVLFGLIGTTFAVMQFLVAPIQGALSDRYGRRPVILVSNIGLGLDYVIMALAPSIAWLFAGRMLSGAAAGSAPAAFAYLTDVTPPEKRAQSFGMMFAVQAVGAALGPALGGILSDIDLRAPFWCAAAFSFGNAAYGYFVLPESLSPERRAAIHWLHLSPIGGLLWLARSYPAMLAMIAVAFLLSLASQGANNVAVVYAQFRYHWTPRDVGILLTVFGVASLAVQGGLVGPAARLFGEKATMVGGLSLTTIGLLIFAFAPSGILFSLAVPFLALGAISGAMMASYFSGAVREEEQGRLQGAWSSVNSMMGLVAPSLFTGIFAASIAGSWTTGPGTAFVASAALLVIAIAISARIDWSRRH